MSKAASRRERAESISRVLIVQTAFLGDVVLTTPLLRELRRALPEAEVCLLTTATGRELLRGLPYVDRFLVLDKRWDREGRRSSRRVLGELLRGRFDAAVAPHRSFRSGLLLRLSGAGVRIGFAGAPGSWAYNRRVVWDGRRHAVHRYLGLADPLGGDRGGTDPRPHLAVGPAAAFRVASTLRREGIGAGDELLCVAPGSIWPTKRWRPEGYARVVEAARGWGLVPVLIGSPEEGALCRTIASLAPAPVLAGKTSIPELVALLARARLVVGNDSGPAHVASAVGTPVVSVFGSTAPAQGYAAFGRQTRVVERRELECRPCGRHGGRVCPRGHFRCMSDLPAARVVEKVGELLAATEQAPREQATAGPVPVERGESARACRAGVAPG